VSSTGSLVSVVVSVGFAIWCVYVLCDALDECGEALQIKAISLCCVLMRLAARASKRILSPARLPVPPLEHCRLNEE
jgi:hypothetical protein